MASYSEFEDIPLHDVRSANDLVPPDQFDRVLPSPQPRLSLLSKIFYNRLLHIAVGVLLALALIAGAVFLGISLGKHHRCSPETTDQMHLTVTPSPVTVVATTTVSVAGGTVTEVRTSTVPFTGVGAISGKTVVTVTQTMELPPQVSGLPG